MTDQIIEIPVNKTFPAEWQPREDFDEEGIQELAQSLKEIGLIQPIVVREHEDGYEIIAGERRWRAFQLNREETITAVVKNANDFEAKEISIIENYQRKDLTDQEKETFIYGLWIEGLKNGEYFTQVDMSQKTGISLHIINKMILAFEDRAAFKKLSPSNIFSKVTTGDLASSRRIKDDPIARAELLNIKVNDIINQTQLRSLSGQLMKVRPETRKETIKLISTKQLEPKEVGFFAKVLDESPRDIKEKLLIQEVTPEEAIKVNKIREVEQRSIAIEENKATKKADYDNNMVELYESIYTNEVALLEANDIQNIESDVHKETCIEYMRKSREHYDNMLLELGK